MVTKLGWKAACPSLELLTFLALQVITVWGEEDLGKHSVLSMQTSTHKCKYTPVQTLGISQLIHFVDILFTARDCSPKSGVQAPPLMLKKVTHLTKDGLLSKELPVPNCTKYCGRNQVFSSGAAGHLHQLPCRGYQPQCWGPGYCKRRRPDCLFQLHVKMLNIWRASMAKIEAPCHFQAMGWDF